MINKYDGKTLRREICKRMGLIDHGYFEGILKNMYLEREMSSIEISEEIERKTELHMDPRSIQRTIARMGVIRSPKEAFNLAIKRGRMRKIKKEGTEGGVRINPGRRFKIMEREGFKCILCGATKDDGRLYVDFVNNDSNNEEDLHTICEECLKGRRVAKI